MTESRFPEGRNLSVFFTAEAAFQSQKKVIVLKEDSWAFHTGSKEKIHNKKMTFIPRVKMGVSRCENQGVIKL